MSEQPIWFGGTQAQWGAYRKDFDAAVEAKVIEILKELVGKI